MEFLKERVSYLKGLSEGLKLDEETKEGKLLINIIDVLDEFADAINDMDEVQDEIAEYVDEIGEELSELEEDFYEDEYYGEDFEDEDLENEYYEIACPNCDHTIVVDEDVFVYEDIVTCPNCETEISFGSEDCECEDCNCHHEEQENVEE